MDLLNPEGGPVLYTTRFPLMGGTGIVRFLDGRGREQAERIARRAEGEARRIERKFSRFLPQSVLTRLNEEAAKGPAAVDDETEGLLLAALELRRTTHGAFDPTIGPLARAWDFRQGIVPTPATLARLLPLVDGSRVELRNGTVRFARPGMELDLGGVGKEYAADAVAELLREDGVACAIVNFSGDVRTVGRKGNGRPWSVGIQDPRDRNRCRFVLRVAQDAGVATSGDYERFFEQDGVRYNHLLDARTGLPARGLASATVVAQTAFAAGRLATAAFLLGPRAGLELLERTPHTEGALITPEGAVLATRGLARISTLGVREAVRASA